MPLNFQKEMVKEPEVNAAQVETSVAEAPEVPVEAAAPAAPAAGEPENLNALSDKIAFVCPLLNPMRDDTTTIELPDGQTEKRVTPFICGYRFKALVDMEVPDCGITPEFKKDYMNYADINGRKAVKAGEEFDCTPFETALMASWPDVNGVFAGGEHRAVCGFAHKVLDSKVRSGNQVQVGSFPRATLRLSPGGSIKDIPGKEVCTKTYEMNEKGKSVKKGTINPGFEKWAPMLQATRKMERSASRNTSRERNHYDSAARRFQELAISKGYKR